ncbi:MAG: tetratricopeptide repeat protein [Blastocatellia bacterium]|nr:tetratricopeptide repeat protein [Blastocatellia bacterium]
MNRILSFAPRVLRTVPILVVFLLCCASLQAQSFIDAAKSAEVDQGRIERAKALMAAHQLETAATELESVRAATKEPALRNITSVMLMNVYLEAGNYTRAEALLDESFKSDAGSNEDSLRTYFALAGQAINGARGHLARYRSFGINVADANLQPEAANDLNRLRALLERMVAQAKTISAGRKAYDSLSLLEDVLGLRLALAKDADDQAVWSREYSGVREVLASSETQVASLGAMPVLPARKSETPTTSTTIVKTGAVAQPQTGSNRVSTTSAEQQPDQEVAGPNVSPTSVVPEDLAKPVDKGSLNSIAAKRVLPHYPTVARQMGMAGLVRVYVILNEHGKVIEVPKSDGPALLRPAAEGAAKQWIFAPSFSEGQPVRVSGYIDFNFTL